VGFFAFIEHLSIEFRVVDGSAIRLHVRGFSFKKKVQLGYKSFLENLAWSKVTQKTVNC